MQNFFKLKTLFGRIMGDLRWFVWFGICIFLVPNALANLVDDVSVAESKARGFTSDYRDVTLIIEGSYATPIEKFALWNAMKRSEVLAAVPIRAETEVRFEDLHGAVIFVGGPTQNSMAAKLLDKNHSSDLKALALGSVELASVPELRAVIVSDRAGYFNLPRTNVRNSPLAKYLPFSLIPIVASLIGIGLIWLWNFAHDITNSATKSFITKSIMKLASKKPINPVFLGFHLAGVRIKAREWAAIGLSAIIFACAISYMYFVQRSDIVQYILLLILVNLIVSGLTNLIRIVLDLRHAIHSEYGLWYFGILITLLTGWLGNVFSVAGYTNSEGHSKREGVAKYILAVIVFIAFIAAATTNLLQPAAALQMISILLLSLAFFTMLPLHPFDGRKIYAWNKVAWWLTMVPITVAYIFISLVV